MAHRPTLDAGHAQGSRGRQIPLASIREPEQARPAPGGWALWQLGFRPFYLLASAFAALSIGLWSLQFSGWLGQPYLQGPLWHAHEMLFGFALAVVVGFLLTAGANWTNRPTLAGLPLAGLAALWIAGRVLVLTPYAEAAAAVNVAFPLAAAIALAIPFVAARSRRNYFFVGLLLLLAAAQLAFHFQQLGVASAAGWASVQVGLDVLLFIMAVMGGRVIPMFTNNGVPGANASRRPWLDKAALAAVLALLAADALQLHGWPLAVLAALAAAAHGARLALWRPWATTRVPLVWILHAGYAWVGAGLILLGLAALVPEAVPFTAGIHALTAGAMGVETLAIMTRATRGHTGRPRVADRATVGLYLLVLSAAATRVAAPFALEWTVMLLGVSAVLWMLAFSGFVAVYGPMLCRRSV